VAGCRERRKARLEFNRREEQIVGVVSRQGENADARIGERVSERFEDTDLGKVQRAEHSEAPEAALGLHIRRDGSLGANDRQLGPSACNGHERAASGPRGNLGVSLELRDGEGLVEELESETALIQ
jgi:hypothetical protein